MRTQNKTLTTLLLLGDEGTGSVSLMESTEEKNGWRDGAEMDVELDVL